MTDTPKGLGTCICERCGAYCSSRAAQCDPCQEVAELRSTLVRVRDHLREWPAIYGEPITWIEAVLGEEVRDA